MHAVAVRAIERTLPFSRSLAGVAACLLTLALSASASAAVTPTFTVSNATTADGPRAVAIGDLNDDGRPDLATVSSTSFEGTATILTKNADDGYTASSAGSAGPVPSSVAIGDLNGDGLPDLAVANLTGAVTVLTKNASAGYTASTAGTTGSNPRSLAIGDLSGDGRPDLVTANTGDNTVTILIKNEGTGYTKSTVTTGNNPSSVAIGDLNGDGRPDLATADTGDNTVSILTKNEGIGYTRSTAGSTDALPQSVAIGDLNGDGRPDLATANIADQIVGGTVTVLTNNADAGYTADTAGRTGRNAVAVVIGDLNDDGRPDLATANNTSGSDTVSILTKNAGAGYTVSTAGVTGSFRSSLTIGDLNADGRLDLASTETGGNTVTVLTNTTDSTPPVTTDDVPRFYRTSPPRVTLRATDDPQGSGVDEIRYGIVTDAEPDPALTLVYDAQAKPVLQDGEAIRYFATDVAGNAETPRTSRAAVVLAKATNDYVPRTAGTTGPNPVSVAVGDLNGDGRPDLATANFDSNTVTVLTKNEDGGYTASTAGTTGARPFSVAIGDLNDDGRPDLATADFGAGTVTVLTKNAGDGYTASTAGLTGGGPNAVAIGDLNDDGRPDLATADRNGNSVTVLTKNEDGGYTAGRAGSTGRRPQSIAIGDLNDDGRVDLATANFEDNSVTVLTKNPGAGYTSSFALAPPPATICNEETGEGCDGGSSPSHPASIAIGDLSLDGRPDLAFADEGRSQVNVLTKNEDGGYTLTTAGSTGSSPGGVAIADLSGDGKLDLATSDRGDGTVTLLTNAGDGSYTRSTAGPTGAAPASVAIDDMDGDDRPDLVTANAQAGTATVLTARYAPPTLTVSPQSLSIGDQITDDGPSPTATATITNPDPEPVDLDGVTLSDAAPEQFEVLDAAGDSTDCDASTVLSRNESCAVRVRFDPGVEGDDSATITVESNAPDVVVDVTGRGVRDTDNDGTGDPTDTDDDNDDVPDAQDVFPLNPNETVDTDNDGTGNNADTDDDNDDVPDAQDAFPLNPNETVDTDNDGTGNNADTDDDNDGVRDTQDAFPLNPNETVDTDNDGTGNNADTDDDNDGVRDTQDAFPLNPNETVDTDNDGTGNNADTDDDNDDVPDAQDAFPLNPNETVDTDNDGTGNNADTDDDNDDVPDAQDAFPFDPSSSATPTVPQVVDPQLACNDSGIALFDARRRDGRVAFSGVTLPRFAGGTVFIQTSGKTVATAIVFPDGRFRAITTGPAPAAGAKPRASYVALIGDRRSSPLALDRKVVLGATRVTGGTVALSGRYTGTVRPSSVTVQLVGSPDLCEKATTLKSGRLSKSGRFRISTAVRPGATIGVYRVVLRARGKIISSSIAKTLAVGVR
ncbi:hypothetical protein GKE82_09535 [Conexibacter sp. W3-3-2]|uniref:FG-GAP-like repeat-containing protein n=1 Tax=Conexibacter sp. W3-3-2 TaxID=2675227 RepID=UPI0012B9972D|nr:FG-GAP-like repeat-containing protein [Conexibacter sp. W3-3-2]MTD44525.1 hypothetical protein [Conexibacter sp. W3-3-2]